MSVSKKLTTVTTLSKTLALILFIGLPFLAFYLGMQYQKGITIQTLCDPIFRIAEHK
ncbi:MAG TPA: hypothetical protein VFQ63_04205 [Patescibacteria group bacterium]|nr:hypothetical protein [Patescibacteria group bacterium]